jgi:DNA-binding CsgD family transcriptional regulator
VDQARRIRTARLRRDRARRAGGPGALAGLTAQQREIVILAGAASATRRSPTGVPFPPRTVASHLYRSYPKLGIAGRHQLRDLIDQAGTARVNS